jgi:hypothetical protein
MEYSTLAINSSMVPQVSLVRYLFSLRFMSKCLCSVKW